MKNDGEILESDSLEGATFCIEQVLIAQFHDESTRSQIPMNILPSGVILHKKTAISPQFGNSGTFSTKNEDIRRGKEVINMNLKSQSGNIYLDGTTLNGSASTSKGNIELTNNAAVTNKLFSCDGNIEVKNSSASTIHNLSGKTKLRNAHVSGDVLTLDGQVSVKDSQIGGMLSVPSEHLKIEGSQVKDIILNVPEKENENDGIVCGDLNGAIIIAGRVYTGVQPSSKGGNVFSLAPGNSIRAGGFEIVASEHRTTLTTPDFNIYRNGKKIYGDGPDTYAEYQKAHRNAPQVSGPGWKSEDVKPGADESKSVPEAAQVLELIDGSIGTGKVVFKSGDGLIIVDKSSKFTGTVEGGKVVYK